MFEDRVEAGRRLADALACMELADPVVLALPRGGVPVAAEVARRLNAPLDIIIVRKVGAPGNRELAVAAIVDGNPPDVVLNRDIVEAYGLDEAEIAQLVKEERPELERRREAYRGKRHALSVTGKTAILVDDGAATGTTMKVAVRAMKRRSPLEIVVAIPVAPPDAVAMLRQETGRVVCLEEPPGFMALSCHFGSFPQLTDEEVISTLHAVARERKEAWLEARKP
jgi:putative phosphoribosyl transferase